jgi:predicted nuclease of restriction endonuclease-like RecB superfamily
MDYSNDQNLNARGPSGNYNYENPNHYNNKVDEYHPRRCQPTSYSTLPVVPYCTTCLRVWPTYVPTEIQNGRTYTKTDNSNRKLVERQRQSKRQYQPYQVNHSNRQDKRKREDARIKRKDNRYKRKDHEVQHKSLDGSKENVAQTTPRYEEKKITAISQGQPRLYSYSNSDADNDDEQEDFSKESGEVLFNDETLDLYNNIDDATNCYKPK